MEVSFYFLDEVVGSSAVSVKDLGKSFHPSVEGLVGVVHKW
jgi:hypothetical protein